MRRNPHRSLTALRCMDLLEAVEFDGCKNSDREWRLNRLRDAIREHMRHEVIRLARRRR